MINGLSRLAVLLEVVYIVPPDHADVLAQLEREFLLHVQKLPDDGQIEHYEGLPVYLLLLHLFGDELAILRAAQIGVDVVDGPVQGVGGELHLPLHPGHRGRLFEHLVVGGQRVVGVEFELLQLGLLRVGDVRDVLGVARVAAAPVGVVLRVALVRGAPLGGAAVAVDGGHVLLGPVGLLHLDGEVGQFGAARLHLQLGVGVFRVAFPPAGSFVVGDAVRGVGPGAPFGRRRRARAVLALHRLSVPVPLALVRWWRLFLPLLGRALFLLLAPVQAALGSAATLSPVVCNIEIWYYFQFMLVVVIVHFITLHKNFYATI